MRSEPEGWYFVGAMKKMDMRTTSRYNFDIIDDDVWILSYPKSGRTIGRQGGAISEKLVPET